jgi:hypothetical protein
MENAKYFESGNEQAFLDLLGDIPFGQSDFQNLHLQLKQDNTTRTFRQVLLEMSDKFKALKECQYRRRRFEIKLLWLNRLHALLFFIPSLRRLVQVSIEENNFKVLLENKVLDDAIRTFNMYKKVYDEMPKPTRAEYDAEEVKYWQRRAIQQAEEDIQAMGTISQGNIGLLKKLGFDPNQVKVELLAIVGQAQKQIAEKLHTEALKAGEQVKKDTDEIVKKEDGVV